MIFFAKIVIFCKSIAGPLIEAYTQSYSFGGRIKLIMCQTRHELNVTIHELSTSWKKTLNGGPYINLSSFWIFVRCMISDGLLFVWKLLVHYYYPFNGDAYLVSILHLFVINCVCSPHLLVLIFYYSLRLSCRFVAHNANIFFIF